MTIFGAWFVDLISLVVFRALQQFGAENSSPMRRYISTLVLFTALLMLQGCATTSQFKPVANFPPDKALIYIYRKQNYIGSGESFKIFANHKPITFLTASGVFTDNNYYPYVAAPGEIAFTGKRVTGGEMHLFDFVYSEDKLGELDAKAGQTYYLRFKWKLISMKGSPALVLQDNGTGSQEITNCILAQSFETK